MKKQVVFVHGGETFATYDDFFAALESWKFDPNKDKIKKWKNTLPEALGDDFEVLAPQMPNKQNAKYREWKIWFEKVLPYIRDNVVLVGYSLGGVFLAKYLSENDFPKKICATFLVAAPYDDADSDYSLADFALPQSLERLARQGGKIFIYHSEDDFIVPFADAQKYIRALPGATPVLFKDRSHFLQEEFPELVADIKTACATC